VAFLFIYLVEYTLFLFFSLNYSFSAFSFASFLLLFFFFSAFFFFFSFDNLFFFLFFSNNQRERGIFYFFTAFLENSSFVGAKIRSYLFLGI